MSITGTVGSSGNTTVTTVYVPAQVLGINDLPDYDNTTKHDLGPIIWDNTASKYKTTGQVSISSSEIDLTATTVDLNGNLDVSGTSTLTGNVTAAGTLTVTGDTSVGGDLTVTGSTTFNGGTLTLGDADTDNVVFGGEINSHLIPNTDDTYDLGESGKEWRNLYVDGTAYIDALTVGNITTTGHWDANDNDRLKLGNDDDLQIYHDGTNSYITNDQGALKIATEDSGIAVQIGHTTSEVTINDNLTVTGNFTVSGTTTTVDSTTVNIQNAFVFEGATADAYETTLSTVDPTADRTLLLPNASDTLVGKATTDTLTNKTLTTPIIEEIDSGSSITLDATTDIVLDANGGDIFFKDNGTTFATITNNGGNLTLKNGSTPALTFSGANATAAGTFTNTGATTLSTSLNIASDGATVTGIKDEDDMSSNSAVKLATQQSIKAYVDAQVTAQDLDFQGDSGGALSIDLDSETLDIAGGTGIDTSGSSNTLTVAIDSTVTTLSDTQTLTNKTLTSPDINTPDIDGGTIDGATIATSDVTVGAGKTLDVSAGTLTLTNNQISGDAVEGGTIAATTITALTTAGITASANIDIGAYEMRAQTFQSDVTTGTAPFTVASTTKVTNFNADLLDGMTTIDEDDMTSDSATSLPTQQSVKAYVDSQVTAQDLDFQGDSGGALSIDLDSETLDIAGGTGLTSVGSSNTVTINLDDTAVTAGSYGAGTAIPTFTVDAQGRLTAAGTVALSTALPVTADSGTQTAATELLTDTLNFDGTANQITTAIASSTTTDTITIGMPDDVTIDGILTVDGASTLTGNVSAGGTLDVTGATTLNGAVTLGNATADDIVVTGRIASHVVPKTNDTYDLGTSSLRYRELFLSGSTINLGGATISSDGSGEVAISGDGVTLPEGSNVGEDKIAAASAFGVPIYKANFYSEAGGLVTRNAVLNFKAVTDVFTNFTFADGTTLADEIGRELFRF